MHSFWNYESEIRIWIDWVQELLESPCDCSIEFSGLITDGDSLISYFQVSPLSHLIKLVKNVLPKGLSSRR